MIARIYLDPRADLRAACLPDHERAVASLDRALRKTIPHVAKAAGVEVEYVDMSEESNALGREVWQCAHNSIAVGPRGGAKADLIFAACHGNSILHRVRAGAFS